MTMRVLRGIAACTFLLAAGTVASAQFYNRAPDVLPGITAEMRTPGFWIARMDKPDEVILSPADIQTMNDEYRRRIVDPAYIAGLSKERALNTEHWWPGFEAVMPDFAALDPSAAADTTRAKVLRAIGYVKGRPFSNIHNIQYADWEIENFVRDMNLDGVPNRIQSLRGLAVRTTRVRNIPAFSPFYVGYWKPGGSTMDMFMVGILDIGGPVTVLHRSRTGEHLFVAYKDGYGWVESADIAIGDPRDVEWFATTDEFAVCTGDREMLYTDEDCTIAYGWFGMGDRLPLVAGSGRQVQAPFRQADGSLIFQPVWLRERATVSRGWLPYTRRNIVNCAFRILDIPFDWTGGWLGRSAETPYRDIFACFGFELPFHGLLFTHFGNNTAVTKPLRKERADDRNPGAGDSGDGRIQAPEQFGIINSMEPFITLIIISNGHTQLYLGNVNGDPIVFDDHGYAYDTADGTHYEIKRSVISNMAMNIPSYALPNPLRFATLK